MYIRMYIFMTPWKIHYDPQFYFVYIHNAIFCSFARRDTWPLLKSTSELAKLGRTVLDVQGSIQGPKVKVVD